MSTGEKLLELIEEGLALRSEIKIKMKGWNSLRWPSWYDKAKARLREIEEELSKMMETKNELE